MTAGTKEKAIRIFRMAAAVCAPSSFASNPTRSRMRPDTKKLAAKASYTNHRPMDP